LGYVHFERVRTGTSQPQSTSTLDTDTDTDTSSLTFFCTLDTSPSVDRGRRLGPEVRTMTLIGNAVLSPFPLFVYYNTTIFINFSSCFVCVVCLFVTTILFLPVVQTSIRDTPLLLNRRSFKNQVPNCQLANNGWTLGMDYKGVDVVLCCTIRSGQGKRAAASMQRWGGSLGPHHLSIRPKLISDVLLIVF